MVPIISATAVTQIYGQQVILKDINLQIAPGKIVALIGPSGAGKTTLVRAIMGMITPKAGRITVLNQKMPNRQVLGQIGYMAQTDALYETLTARENLQFFGKLQGLKQQQLNQKIAQAVAVVNLSADLNKQVKVFSGGMKRRLSLAIALVAQPQLLILDEPTVGIDPELRQQIWRALHQLAQAGKTILLTTHVMSDAAQADQILMIRAGKMIAQGTVQALEHKYQVTDLEAVFLAAGRAQDAHISND
ncbi:heme ABC exporter ATP-binding protein CcmA [Agrilactobacillus fermenti]|uniref:heme ABC exporter ATP-binding protein CcmA n=1 Tax=Agrilactobacillus fermenti TaxID=2586909 RepID=UPI001E415FEA|nr:heme ABC exporter ATP-binding protein CcmA [Agrilactobacillus fermenti]MCD2256806.1 heme ABC exporter ATP-binding protein CcmA [Agrilactobacillus fermenti]